jgi:hypothetical protein
VSKHSACACSRSQGQSRSHKVSFKLLMFPCCQRAPGSILGRISISSSVDAWVIASPWSEVWSFSFVKVFWGSPALCCYDVLPSAVSEWVIVCLTDTVKQGVKWWMFSVSSATAFREPVLTKHILMSLKLLSGELAGFIRCSHLTYPQHLWWDPQTLTVIMRVSWEPSGWWFKFKLINFLIKA